MTNDQIPKRPIVITGGDGFAGRYLRKELEREWPGVEAESWDLPDVDITKPETYRDRLKDLQPEWLVHLAAISSVPTAEQDPELVQRVNVEASQNIFKAVQELSPKTKIFVTSSADIYGEAARETGGSPLSELRLDICQPLNVYARSKWEMEEMIEEKFRDRVLRVRPFPHIGPGQALGFVTADFASQVALIEKGGQKPTIKVGSLEAKRDFTDVRDVARAYRTLMEQGELGEVYHVASGEAIAIQEVLDKLLAMSEVEITVEQDPERVRVGDIPVLVGDAGKLRALTGWKPEIPLEQSLREILDWWREHT